MQMQQMQQMQQMHDHGSVRTDFCIHVAPVAYYTMYLYNIMSIMFILRVIIHIHIRIQINTHIQYIYR